MDDNYGHCELWILKGGKAVGNDATVPKTVKSGVRMAIGARSDVQRMPSDGERLPWLRRRLRIA
jgi:hypothetical protein